MDTVLNKLSNSSPAIAENLLNSYDFARNFDDSHFSILILARNEYYILVLNTLFTKTFRSLLYKQQYVYKSNLKKLL